MDEKQALDEMREHTKSVNDKIDEFNSTYNNSQNDKEIEERIARLEATGINFGTNVKETVENVEKDIEEHVKNLSAQSEFVAQKLEENVVEPVKASAQELRDKLTDRLDTVKTNLVGEDGKLDKEDIERVSNEVVEKVQESAEKVKETVLGEDEKFTKEDLERLAHGLMEVGSSLAKLGEKKLSKLITLLEDDK